MPKVTYEKIVDSIFELFPDFKESKGFKELLHQDDLELPYIVWSVLVTHYILPDFFKNGEEDEKMNRLIGFINEQFASPESDQKLLELFQVQVFEDLSQHQSSLDFARKHTNPQARKSLEYSLVYTGVDRPDLSIVPEAKQHLDAIKKINEGKWTREDTIQSYAKSGRILSKEQLDRLLPD